MDSTRSFGLNICGCVHLMMNFLITLSVKMSAESDRQLCFLVMGTGDDQGLSPLTFGIRSHFGSPCSLFPEVVLLSYQSSSLLSFLSHCPPVWSILLTGYWNYYHYWLASCVQQLFQNETEMISSNNKKGAIITAVVWNHTECCTLSLYPPRAVSLF